MSSSINWDAVAAIGSLVGGIAVVATLIYLALEVRANTKAQRIASRIQLFDRWADQHRDLVSVSWLPRVVRRGMTDFDSLTRDEKINFDSHFTRHAMLLIEARTLRDEGGLADEDYQALETVYLSVLHTPGGQAWWRQVSHGHTVAGPGEADGWAAYVEQRLADTQGKILPLNEAYPFYAVDPEEVDV